MDQRAAAFTESCLKPQLPQAPGNPLFKLTGTQRKKGGTMLRIPLRIPKHHGIKRSLINRLVLQPSKMITGGALNGEDVVNVYIYTMEITIFDRKSKYKQVMFNSYVKLPGGSQREISDHRTLPFCSS